MAASTVRLRRDRAEGSAKAPAVMYHWKTGQHLPDFPAWVDEYDRTTLGEIMEELGVWYWTNRRDSPEPDGYPELEPRG